MSLYLNNGEYYYEYIPDCKKKGYCQNARTDKCCYYRIKVSKLEVDHPELGKKAGDSYILEGY